MSKRQDALPEVKWDKIKEFINEMTVGQTFVRIYLLKSLDAYGNFTQGCFDNYRNILTKSGYLKIISRGNYKVMKKIPIDLKLQDCINSCK